MPRTPEDKRVEVRFPDPSANPYLAFTAILMAGLDGIEHKLEPGDAMDRNLYDLRPEEAEDLALGQPLAGRGPGRARGRPGVPDPRRRDAARTWSRPTSR